MMNLTAKKPTELTDRKPTMDDIRRGCDSFDYLDIRAAELLHIVWVVDGWACVIADSVASEWVHVQCGGKHFIDAPHFVPRPQDAEVWTHSNEGWGSDAAALLDVLLQVEGGRCSGCGCCVLPDEINIKCPKCA